jgi:hypothetical protein
MVSYNTRQTNIYSITHTKKHTRIILRTGIDTSRQSEQWVGYDKEKGKAGKEKNKKK